MPTLFSYRKNGKELKLGIDEGDYRECATINGVTYIAVRDGVRVDCKMGPNELCLAEISPIELGSECYRETIKDVMAAMPETKAINDQVVARIRERYSIDDEIKMLRIAPSYETQRWNDYVESCLEWGRLEKANFGLSPKTK
jgi:hypothetical protein